MSDKGQNSPFETLAVNVRYGQQRTSERAIPDIADPVSGSPSKTVEAARPRERRFLATTGHGGLTDLLGGLRSALTCPILSAKM
jgi:hypothetical protein